MQNYEQQFYINGVAFTKEQMMSLGSTLDWYEQRLFQEWVQTGNKQIKRQLDKIRDIIETFGEATKTNA